MRFAPFFAACAFTSLPLWAYPGMKDSETPAEASKAPEKLVSLDLSLDPKLAVQAKELKTLFITVYNAESSGRMPYAAMKIEVKETLNKLYVGDLTTENMMLMDQGPVPSYFRVKARLDKDGDAGPDSPGDLVGQVDKVKKGDRVSISINKAI